MTGEITTTEKRAVLSLASLYVFRMLGLFMVLPVLVIYGDQYTDSTPMLLGLALGIYGLTQAILQIPFGTLSDVYGRKPIIFIGLAIFILGSVVAAMSTSVWGLIIGRALQGAGAISSALIAMVADLTKEENRSKAMATIGASIGVAFALAMILGPAIASWGGLSSLFWVIAALGVLGMLILAFKVPTPVRAKRSANARPVKSMVGDVLRDGELMRLNIGVFVLHGVLMASFVAVPLVLEGSLGIVRERHWQVYLPIVVIAFIGMVPFMIIAEKRRRIKEVMLAAIALLVISEALMSVAWSSTAGFLTLLFTFFLAFNLLEATLPSLMSKIAPPAAKGTASGVYSTFQFLGTTVGGMGGGWALQHYGPESVFTGAGVALLGWFLIARSMRRPRFLNNVELPLHANADESANDQLSAIPGVEDVVWVKEENVAYLKVDPSIFNKESLAPFMSMEVQSGAQPH